MSEAFKINFFLRILTYGSIFVTYFCQVMPAVQFLRELLRNVPREEATPAPGPETAGGLPAFAGHAGRRPRYPPVPCWEVFRNVPREEATPAPGLERAGGLPAFAGHSGRSYGLPPAFGNTERLVPGKTATIQASIVLGHLM